jgi:four helix bundle protein
MRAWRAARSLTMTIYRLTEAPHLQKDTDLRRQMRRESAALMSEVAELYHSPIGAGSLHSIRNARSAVIRLLSHLACAVDRCYIERETFDHLSDSAEELKEEIAEYLIRRR